MTDKTFTWTSQYNATTFKIIVADLDTIFEKQPEYSDYLFFDAAGDPLDRDKDNPLGVHMDLCFHAHKGSETIVLIDIDANLHQSCRAIMIAYMSRFCDNSDSPSTHGEEFVAYDLGILFQSLVCNKVLDLTVDPLITRLVEYPGIVGFDLFEFTGFFVGYGTSKDIAATLKAVYPDDDDPEGIGGDCDAQSWCPRRFYIFMYPDEDKKGLENKQKLERKFINWMVHECVHQTYAYIKMIGESNPSVKNFATFLATHFINALNAVSTYVSILINGEEYDALKAGLPLPMIHLPEFITQPAQKPIAIGETVLYVQKKRAVLSPG